MKIDNSHIPDLMTAAEVCAITGLAISTLHDYAVRREAGLPPQGPPHVRLGPRRRRWMRSDVIDWLQASRIAG